MTLLAEIKAKQLEARKSRDTIATALLTTLIGEASMPGKNDGNRESTDAEVVAVIKKFVKNTKEVLNVTQFLPTIQDQNAAKYAAEELKILESFLPAQLTEEELRSAITLIISMQGMSAKPQMGMVMKALKEQFEGQYDGALASKLIKEALNGQV